MHDYVTVWAQGETTGHVVDKPDREHPVRVVGFTYEHTAQSNDDVLDDFRRGHRMTNRPVFVSLAHAKALLDRYAPPESYDRLVALTDVFTFANWYRMEVI